jgi:hypothetical protein
MFLQIVLLLIHGRYNQAVGDYLNISREPSHNAVFCNVNKPRLKHAGLVLS